jgi:hypothetical protein
VRKGKGVFPDVGASLKKSEDLKKHTGGAGKKNKECWEYGATKGSARMFFASKDKELKELLSNKYSCVL